MGFKSLWALITYLPFYKKFKYPCAKAEIKKVEVYEQESTKD